MDAIIGVNVAIDACVRVHDPQKGSNLLLIRILHPLRGDKPEEVPSLAY
jgi:hypothetical protein